MATPCAVNTSPSDAAEAATTFLGRPAVVLHLGVSTSTEGGERSHKRSRPNDSGQANGDGAPGGVHQVARAMLRAHKLGVLVPLLYSADPVTGVAVVEEVPGRRLRELMAEAAGEQAAKAGAAEAEAAGPETAATDVAEAAAAPAQAAGAAGPEAASTAEAQAEAGPSNAAMPVQPAAAQAPNAPASGQKLAGLPADLGRVAAALGRTLAALHDGGQVHGALRGEAVLLREGDGAVVLTDFRRSYNTIVPLDKASDLAGLQAALAAEAAEAEAGGSGAAALAAQLYEQVLVSYRATSRYWSATHNKLPEARARVRAQPPPSKRPKVEPGSKDTAPAAAAASAAP